MRAIFQIFLLLILFCHNAQAEDKITIAVFGDSLTSGYKLAPEDAFPAKLQRKLQQSGFTYVDVINMSVPGETTEDGLKRVDSVVAIHPDMVILEFGANDVLRGVSPAVIYQNLASIIAQLQQNQSYILLAGMKATPNRDSQYANYLDRIYQSLSGTVSVYPFILEGVAGKPELNLADGLHPNAEGVKVMVDGMYPMIDAGLRYILQTREYRSQSAPSSQPIPLPQPQ